MVIQRIVGTITTLIFLGWATLSPLQPATIGSLEAPAPLPLQTFVGQIIWINPTGQILEVKSTEQGEPVRFLTDQKTLIMQGHYPLSLDDLVPGEQVEVQYNSQEEGKVAQTILTRSK